MDSVRATQMSQELIGTEIGGWELVELKGFGKSALVIIGKKEGQVAAVKIFDPELVERFGKENQLKRIKRELELVDHGNPHLVKILDGGECPITGHLYLTMELHDWPSLDEVLNDVPHDKIWSLIGFIAGATKYLEDIGIAHRDIKPSNIIVSPDFTDARLLDLGVIRPIGDSDLTDIDEKVFIGTLRYSPPELLLRNENDTIEGWRAVTFYQIGAVLHDVIMCKPLFDDYSEPYGRLVHAVDKEIPIIKNESIDSELILLAKNCLTKKPDLRCKLVSWESFTKAPDDISASVKLKHKILQRKKAALLSESDLKAEEKSRVNSNRVGEVLNQIASVVRKVRVAAEYLPPSEQKISNQPDEGTGKLTLLFKESIKYAVSVKFSILIETEVVDPMDSVVIMRYIATIGDDVSDEDNEVDARLVYEGVLDEGALEEKIENIFLHVVDNVQESNTINL